MTARPSTMAHDVVSEMEGDIADVRRWGEVLFSMGSSDEIRPEACSVIAFAILEIGERFQTQWEKAFSLTRKGY